jgi:hypothetical protein
MVTDHLSKQVRELRDLIDEVRDEPRGERGFLGREGALCSASGEVEFQKNKVVSRRTTFSQEKDHDESS